MLTLRQAKKFFETGELPLLLPLPAPKKPSTPETAPAGPPLGYIKSIALDFGVAEEHF
jgi:hypothetical protein